MLNLLLDLHKLYHDVCKQRSTDLRTINQHRFHCSDY